MRALLYFMLTALVIGVYGGRVCPVIQAASVTQWGSFLFLCFLSAVGLRAFLLPKAVIAAAGDVQPRLEFMLDLGLYILAALATCVFAVLMLGSPIPNGIKVFVGVMSVGFFFSIDLALLRERDVVLEARRRGLDWHLAGRYFPVTRKFAFVAGACVIFTALVIAGVVIKNIYEHYPETQGPQFWTQAMYWVALDLGFAMLCLSALAMLVISSFARNLRLFFGFQTQSLDAVAKGNLNERVPVVSNDEFGFIARHTNLMIQALEQRTGELERTQDATIVTLASLAETRDNETGAHILRTQRYVRALAVRLSVHSRYASFLTPETIELLYKSAPLHDVGKVGVPDAILLKPGRHTPEEFEVMKMHTVYGRDALKVAEGMLGSNSFLHLAQEIAYTHHEKWDGSGYPLGLSGQDIPMSGRLMALADVYDALISKRVYKPAFPHEKAKQIILEGRDSHFDPEVVDAFLAIENEFLGIAAAFKDAHEV
jgi:HD-GYP domain-containing protein (c-di-GMP phosphodiesterase class II)